MERRFFCTIFAQDRKHLIGLNKFDVDVFQPTARITEKQEYVIEGLLTLEQVVNLIDKHAGGRGVPKGSRTVSPGVHNAAVPTG